MIPINELRYGSWVSYDGKEVQIAEIDGGSGYVALFSADWDSRRNNIRIGWIEPIKLTPDVLKRCGFQKSWNGLSLPLDTEGDLIYIVMFTGADGFSSGGLEREFNDITYAFGRDLTTLHQLQNLYHAITGKELNYQSDTNG